MGPPPLQVGNHALLNSQTEALLQAANGLAGLKDDDEEVEEEDDDVKEFGCELCNESFDTLPELTSHQVLHMTSPSLFQASYQEEAIDTSETTDGTFKPFKCK